MEKVYIVKGYEEWENPTVMGIFSKKELAEKAVEEYEAKHPFSSVDIEEVKINQKLNMFGV